MGVLILWALALLIPLAGQLLFLRLTRSRRRLRFLRWLLPLGTAGFLADAWRNYHAPTFFIGLHELVALVDVIAAAAVLLGWGAAWGLFALWTRRKEAL